MSMTLVRLLALLSCATLLSAIGILAGILASNATSGVVAVQVLSGAFVFTVVILLVFAAVAYTVGRNDENDALQPFPSEG